MIQPHVYESNGQGDCRHCPLPERHPRAHIPGKPLDPTAEDPALAERLKNDGQDRALTGAADWAVAATNVLAGLAATGDPFTADDLIAGAGLPNESEANGNNAIGSLFSAARKRGQITPVMLDDGYGGQTPKTVPSKRALGHGRRVTVWVGRGPSVPRFDR